MNREVKQTPIFTAQMLRTIIQGPDSNDLSEPSLPHPYLKLGCVKMLEGPWRGIESKVLEIVPHLYFLPATTVTYMTLDSVRPLA